MIGQLLIAPPAQTDDYWGKSVVLLYEKTQAASVGLILNKPSERSVKELAEHHGHEFKGDDIIYVGGPVNPSALVMLHTDDWTCSNTMQVTDTLRLSSDRSMIKRLCAGDRPTHWRLFLGMSAWTPSQLEGEMNGTAPWSKKTAWATCPSNTPIVFDLNPDRMWKRSIDFAAQKMVDSYFTIN